MLWKCQESLVVELILHSLSSCLLVSYGQCSVSWANKMIKHRVLQTLKLKEWFRVQTDLNNYFTRTGAKTYLCQCKFQAIMRFSTGKQTDRRSHALIFERYYFKLHAYFSTSDPDKTFSKNLSEYCQIRHIISENIC